MTNMQMCEHRNNHSRTSQLQKQQEEYHRYQSSNNNHPNQPKRTKMNMSIVKCITLFFILHSIFTLSTTYASPITVHQDDQSPQSPSVVPIPDTDISPTPSTSPATPTPSSTPATPTTPSPSLTPDQTVTATPALNESPEASPDVEGAGVVVDSGSGLSTGAIVGIVIGALLAALILLLCCWCLLIPLFFKDRKGNNDNNDANANNPNQTAIYSSSEAAATPPPPPPPAVVPPPPPFTKDEARQFSSDDDPNNNGGNELAAGNADPASVGATTADGAAPIPRGPTPPPHDYVLGVGPAATKKDFDDIQAKCERDEIGDDSAVLGIDRSPSAKQKVAQPLIAEGDTSRDMNPTPGVATFEKQEEIPGGDGSGAISDAAMTLNNPTITEEGGDVPSLERDPIELSRERGEHPF